MVDATTGLAGGVSDESGAIPANADFASAASLLQREYEGMATPLSGRHQVTLEMSCDSSFNDGASTVRPESPVVLLTNPLLAQFLR